MAFTVKDKRRKIISTANVQAKNKEINSSHRIDMCIDWYLVTTYHWADGSTTESWDYLGTTCDDCDNPEMASICPDDGGGGGGAPPDPIVGENDATGDDSETDPGSGGPGSGGVLLSVVYKATVAWSFNSATRDFNYINQTMPTATPATQDYQNNNGNWDRLNVEVLNWSTSQTRLSYNAVSVQWYFEAQWSYVLYQAGTYMTSHFNSMGTIIGP